MYHAASPPVLAGSEKKARLPMSCEPSLKLQAIAPALATLVFAENREWIGEGLREGGRLTRGSHVAYRNRARGL